jgi:hypothetical protein
VWPANFVVARAYLDQLTRSHALPAKQLASLEEAIAKGEPTSSDRKSSVQFKSMAETLEKEAPKAKSPADAERIHALAAILKQK